MHTLRLIIAGAAVATALLAVTAASALANPLVSDTPLAGGTREIFHTCKVIGTPVSGVEAVHCADLFETAIPGTVPDFVAENEVLCQTTPADALVECAGIHEQPEIAASIDMVGLSVGPGPRGVCGVRFGHSACGVRRVTNTSPAMSFTPDGDLCGVWAVTVADSVVLPGSGVTENAPNLATPHTTANC